MNTDLMVDTLVLFVMGLVMGFGLIIKRKWAFVLFIVSWFSVMGYIWVRG